MLGDIEFASNLLQKAPSGREFTARLLQNQFVFGKEHFQDFGGVSDSELRELGRQFIRQEQNIFKHFEEGSDLEFFDNFREAVGKYRQEWIEKLAATIHRGIQTSQKEADKFTLEFLKPLAEAWKIWLESNRTLLNPFVLLWRQFKEHYRASDREAYEILVRYKWLLTPSLPADFLFEVAEIGKRKCNQRRAINRLFVDHFYSNECAALSELVDGWKSNALYKPRMKIFRDCVSTIVGARTGTNASNMVIPALIAQIDGIQSEFMRQRGIDYHLLKRTYKGDRLKACFQSEPSLIRALDSASNLFLNILFQTAKAGQPLRTPFAFNRHKIMHGEDLHYGRRDNTIRAFLILDFLAWLE
ncbi:MAG: hypothetical protein V1784_07690 [bacterium]